jgi:hypothetical protein
MSNSPKYVLVSVLCSAALAGCTTTHPVNYQRLTSASQLAPNPQDKHGHVPFLYSAVDIDWHKYNAVIVDRQTRRRTAVERDDGPILCLDGAGGEAPASL